MDESRTEDVVYNGESPQNDDEALVELIEAAKEVLSGEQKR